MVRRMPPKRVFWNLCCPTKKKRYDNDYRYVICRLPRLYCIVRDIPKEGLPGPHESFWTPQIFLLAWQRQRFKKTPFCGMHLMVCNKTVYIQSENTTNKTRISQQDIYTCKYSTKYSVNSYWNAKVKIIIAYWKKIQRTITNSYFLLI